MKRSLTSIVFFFVLSFGDAQTQLLDSLQRTVFLIFKESVNNAAKYSNANRIDVSLEKQDHVLVMKVKDDGQGFDEKKVRAGNGLRNLRERAKEINGSIKLTSQIGKGTEIELRLPIA